MQLTRSTKPKEQVVKFLNLTTTSTLSVESLALQTALVVSSMLMSDVCEVT